MKRKSHKRIEVNLEELDRIIDHGMDVPLSKAEGQKIKAALHAMAETDGQEEYGEDRGGSAEAKGSGACEGASYG
jgi:hypothetical protein